MRTATLEEAVGAIARQLLGIAPPKMSEHNKRRWNAALKDLRAEIARRRKAQEAAKVPHRYREIKIETTTNGQPMNPGGL